MLLAIPGDACGSGLHPQSTSLPRPRDISLNPPGLWVESQDWILGDSIGNLQAICTLFSSLYLQRLQGWSPCPVSKGARGGQVAPC